MFLLGNPERVEIRCGTSAVTRQNYMGKEQTIILLVSVYSSGSGLCYLHASDLETCLLD